MLASDLLNLRTQSQISGIPLDYLLKQVKILDLQFKLNSSVLIPRWETELLVKSIVFLVTDKKIDNDSIINLPSEIKKAFVNSCVLDLGCGSGLVGLSLQKYLPNTEVIYSDFSYSALQMAKTNASQNNLHTNNFFISDLLNNLFLQKTLIKESQTKNFVLIANLPYLPNKDFDKREEYNVVFEPKMALYSGFDGLLTFKKLLKQIKEFKIFPNLTIFELDPRNIKKAKVLLSVLYKKTLIVKDLDNFDRFLCGWN